jgi:hypothetical protein
VRVPFSRENIHEIANCGTVYAQLGIVEVLFDPSSSVSVSPFLWFMMLGIAGW